MRDRIIAFAFALIIFLSVAATAILALLNSSGIISCPLIWTFAPLAIPMLIMPFTLIVAFICVTIKDIFYKARGHTLDE